MCAKLCVYGLLCLICAGTAQREAALPLSADSFRQILRTFTQVPEGRSMKLSDIRIRHYGNSTTKPTMYRIGNVKRVLSDKNFDVNRLTTFYIHGYAELWNDSSVETVVRAYLKRGGGNLLVLDWSNLGYGDYIGVGFRIQPVGLEVGKALWALVRGGRALHVVGHSMGVAVAAVASRYLAARGYRVPRITGLDPAYPGFYLPRLFTSPVSAADAVFVDIVHTDGGGFGAPVSTGHADFWPNAGSAKQPGCLPLTLPLTVEDFCSHWRSWQYWAEAVASEEPVFLARRCEGYDSFLRGRCRDQPLVHIGVDTDPTLRGNFYLRTAAEEPFALGVRGAE